MESLWFIAVVSVCISSLLVSLFNLLFFSSTKKKLPPGPQTVPVIGSFLWLRKSFSELEPILRNLRYKYGPLVTLWIGSRPAIFVGSHTLAHIALVQKGAFFSDRPKALPTAQFLNSNQHNISSAFYGPIWRLLRRNLTSEILHPSRVKTYSRARKWVLTILIQRLLLNSSSSSSSQVVVESSDSDNNNNNNNNNNKKEKEKEKEDDDDDQKVKVVDHFQYAMFCLLVLMCFGDKLDEKQIKSIETVQRDLLLSFRRFNILNFWPRVGKVVFRNRWKELMQLRLNQEAVLIPLITSRIQLVKQRKQREEEGKADYQYPPHPPFIAYVDTLVDVELPDEEEEEEKKKKRKLDTGEMMSLCSEFLNGGTDTTSTALQWIMANLVKYPDVQAKLYEDICGVMGPPPTTALMSTIKIQKQEEVEEEEEEEMVAIKEEDLHRMKYLKAVVLEGLRRHPPGHFVLPHSVSKEVELDGYVVPKNATVNFMVAEMGWDPKVWDEPMEFKPERFLFSASSDHADQEEEGVFDISGSREIKMMPFGAGRRICPASGLALLHLEYFVANLVWYFEWGSGDDAADVDLSEKQEFTVVMKNPLRAHISPRLIS